MTARAPRPEPASAARLRVDQCRNGSVRVSFLDADGQPFAEASLSLQTAANLGLTPNALAGAADRRAIPSTSGDQA